MTPVDIMRDYLLDSPSFRKYLNTRILCEVATDQRRLALTFDDGPHPDHTPQLLDLLAQKTIRATFFVVGRRARRFSEILTRTARAGHEIGNHTDRHMPLSLLPESMIRREITAAEEAIIAATSTKPRFLRPPMGWFNNRVLRVARDMDYEPVIGSIHPRDSRRPGVSAILERIRKRVELSSMV
jgi:peptidoglycan/xylan/chitin deacetylase (PgdA/CDA1 family)